MLHAKGNLHLGEDFDGQGLAQMNGREPLPFHGRSGHVDRGLRGGDAAKARRLDPRFPKAAPPSSQSPPFFLQAGRERTRSTLWWRYCGPTAR